MSVETSGTGAVATAGSGARSGVSAAAAPAMGRGGIESSVSFGISTTGGISSFGGEKSAANGFAMYSIGKDHHTKVNNSPITFDRQLGQTELKGLKASPIATPAKEIAAPKVNAAPKMSLKGLPELKVTPPGPTDTFNTQELVDVNKMTTIAKAPSRVTEIQQRLNTKSVGPMVQQPTEIQQPAIRISISPEGKISQVQNANVLGRNNNNGAENKGQNTHAPEVEATKAVNETLDKRPNAANLENLAKNSQAVKQLKDTKSQEGKLVPSITEDQLSKLYLEQKVVPLISPGVKVKETSGTTNSLESKIAPHTKSEKNQNIVRPAELAAKEYKLDLPSALDLIALAEAVKAEAPIGSDWSKINPVQTGIDALHDAQVRTGNLQALVTAREVGVERPEELEEEVQTTTQQEHQENLVNEVKTDVKPQELKTAQAQAETQTATLPGNYLYPELSWEDEEELDTEEAALLELKDQPIEVQTSSDGSTITETTIQGDTVVEEITEVKLVIDRDTMNRREEYARAAARVIFDARARHPVPYATGPEIAASMPDETEQQEDVKSPLLRGVLDHSDAIDGSYRGFVSKMSQVNEFTSEQQVEVVAAEASEANPAIRAVITNIEVAREATPSEKRNVMDPSSRNTRRPAA